MKNNYCVIMAGGVGSRFWPLSQEAMPKQFLDILGVGKSFIRSTFERFLPVVPVENFLVVTSINYRDLVLEHIPELRPDQVLCEPLRRNTAPCIAYASYRILKASADANVIVTPSDHLVTNEAEFQRIVSEGLDFVDNGDNLLTIGIRPSRAETGYGYIQIDPHRRIGEFNKVKTFTEKPNIDLARAFVDSGEFFWNSGIFIWSVSGIIDALELHVPELNKLFAEEMDSYGTPGEQEVINNLYSDCTSISIDYAVMEKADNVYVRQADFGWSDIGTWGSLYTHAAKDENGNAVINGNVLVYDTRNTIVNVPCGKVAVVEGLDGYMVVATDDNVMICRLESEQLIRNFTEDVKYNFGEKYI